MNLDLPPRRELPFEVLTRMRARVLAGLTEPPAGRLVNLRAPLAAAAGVAVLAAGAAIVAQSTAGSGEGDGVLATPPTTSRSSIPRRPTSSRPPGVAPTPLPIPPLDQARAAEDLDRCAAVAAASPRAHEFAPRQAWQPVYAVELNGHRITAYREGGGRPMFCDTTATTATVSDPSAEPMTMIGRPPGGSTVVDLYGLYLSPAGVLAGVLQGAARLDCEVGTLVSSTGGFEFQGRTERASVQGIQFVVHVGTLKDGDEIVSTVYDANGTPLSSGGFRFERARVRPVGATAVDRPR
ncbi:MAG TPA: hypothetical protein VGX25_23890 [Actinophytocola sp.]|uniref:hypothetical protein n=1 Tax=Actinophytocola sp. TaxID=1872138 RepID=UPI002DDCA152|nr:hypothetical protein [Actinophytocola sp.]HEV2782446.1 hypothetical protein [Actinophytocola sp.]